MSKFDRPWTAAETQTQIKGLWGRMHKIGSPVCTCLADHMPSKEGNHRPVRGVCPPLGGRKPPARASELLPAFAPTMREVVADFEQRNHLRRTKSGSDIRPLDWDEWRALKRGLFELLPAADGSDLA